MSVQDSNDELIIVLKYRSGHLILYSPQNLMFLGENGHPFRYILILKGNSFGFQEIRD